MQTLVWNGNNYECEYEGKTLYVDGDAWMEARIERAREYLAEKHPDLSKDEINERIANEDEEAEKCYWQATAELLKPAEWYDIAVEVDEEGQPLEPISYNFDAWIRG